MANKSWQEKLKRGDSPSIERNAKGDGTMLIPVPYMIDDLARKIKKGKLATPKTISEKLAKDAGADSACPLVTGISVRICAEAAEEERAKGEKKIAHWWRIVKSDGSLNEKMPQATDYQKTLLEAEGHEIEIKGKNNRAFVLNFEKKLQNFDY